MVMGDRPSRLGEWISPRRESVSVRCCARGLSHSGSKFELFGDGVSRSGDSPSPKREIEGGFAVKFNSSPRREILASERKVVSPKRARLTQARVQGLFVRGAR